MSEPLEVQVGGATFGPSAVLTVTLSYSLSC